MSATAARAIAVTTALLALAGCAERDPYLRTDVWRPTGANAQNMVAMMADPHDMIRGRGVTRVDAHVPTIAIDRMWSGRTSKLPSLSGSSSGGGGDSGSGGGSGSGAGSGGEGGSGSSASGAQ